MLAYEGPIKKKITFVKDRIGERGDEAGCGNKEEEQVQTVIIHSSTIGREKGDAKKETIRGEAKPSVSSSLPERCFASPGPCALCSVLSNKTPGLMLENSLQAVNHPL